MTAPDDANAIQLYNEGLHSAKAGHFDEAISLLQRSIEADPSRVDSYNVLGKVLFQMGQTKKAQRYWKAAIELDPFNPTALACLNASGPARWLYKATVPTLLVLLTLVLAWAFRSTRPSDQTVQTGSSIPSPLPSDHPLSPRERPSIADSAHGAQTEPPSARSSSQKLVQAPGHLSEPGSTVHSTETDTLPVQPSSGQSTPFPRGGTEEHREPPLQTIQQVKQHYSAAMSAYRQKQFKTAINKFRAILNAPFPHTLKDNAQYWIGECYYAQGKYERALAAFERVPLLYPKGNKVLHAQIKMAYCYVRLHRHEQARTLLSRLVQEHPQDPAVRRAWALIGE